jgi:hypothetical protein
LLRLQAVVLVALLVAFGGAELLRHRVWRRGA